MSSYLIFQLYGPLVAWGDIAVGERRLAHSVPSKSGVMGLLAACLGIKRHQEQELKLLSAGYHLARLVKPGELLSDFHTAQVPSTTDVNRLIKEQGALQSRREELLASKELNTILSRRDYYCDAFSLICIWASESSPYSLETLSQALEKPVFTPYLGRRSCVAALPFLPKIVAAENPILALKQEFASRIQAGALFFLKAIKPFSNHRYYWEQDFVQLLPQQTVQKRDESITRNPWQFQERTEYMSLDSEEEYVF